MAKVQSLFYKINTPSAPSKNRTALSISCAEELCGWVCPIANKHVCMCEDGGRKPSWDHFWKAMMVVYSDSWGYDATMLQPIVSQWVVTALDESVVGRTGYRRGCANKC